MPPSPALRFDYFAPDANEVAAHAYGIARLYGHQAVEVEHFALAVFEKPGRALPRLFSNLSVNTQAISDRLDALVQALPVKPAQSPDKIYITVRTKSVIDVAGDESHQLREDKIDNVHLLLAIAAETDSPAARALTEAGLTRKRLLQAYQHSPLYAPQAASAGPAPDRAAEFRAWFGATAASTGAALGRLPGLELKRVPVTISPVFLIALGFMTLAGFLTYILSGGLAAFTAYLFIACGWFVGLALHEFGHALAAHQYGDWSVTGTAYFNLNPFKYTHLVYSFILPAVFFLVFRIGLPGPPIFVGFHNIPGQRERNLTWAAGPIASALFGLLIGLPFVLRIQSLFPAGHPAFWNGLAFVAVMQFFTMLISLFPLPGLDGFGILEPYLPDRVLYYVNRIRPYTFIIFLVFFFTPLRLLFDIPFGLIRWAAGL